MFSELRHLFPLWGVDHLLVQVVALVAPFYRLYFPLLVQPQTNLFVPLHPLRDHGLAISSPPLSPLQIWFRSLAIFFSHIQILPATSARHPWPPTRSPFFSATAASRWSGAGPPIRVTMAALSFVAQWDTSEGTRRIRRWRIPWPRGYVIVLQIPFVLSHKPHFRFRF